MEAHKLKEGTEEENVYGQGCYNHSDIETLSDNGVLLGEVAFRGKCIKSANRVRRT
jgi:hypothetical protein